MKFRTEIILNKIKSANHKHKFLLIGSCFTENIGNKLKLSGFDVLQNPFGILYNPYSIANCIYRVLEQNVYTAYDFLFHQNKYINFDLHGKYSHADIQVSINQINESIKAAHNFIKQTNFIIITFGTARVYEYNKKIVANCHKVEQSKFTKRILTTHEIVEQYKELIDKLQQVYKNVRIIFTLSPIRHLRDGFVENQLSKSILHVAIHELVKLYKHIEYFPAYEIQMDDLRDYRFYKEDMIHLTEQAIDYVWQKFSDCYFTEESLKLIENFNKLNALKNHKIISVDNTQQQMHLDKINELEKMLNEKIAKISI